jgi:hypothetical protein
MTQDWRTGNPASANPAASLLHHPAQIAPSQKTRSHYFKKSAQFFQCSTQNAGLPKLRTPYI